MLSIKKSKVLSRVRVESPELPHESESSQSEKSESSTTLPCSVRKVVSRSKFAEQMFMQ